MTSEKGCRKEKNQNIQVFVRLREVVVRQSQQNSLTKRFTFDRAFPPHSKQVEVYQEVVSPLIEEVLAGYNCTVFAYGQTGTGKTHTMVGEAAQDETTWQNDPLAGIIPRALSQLFDELRLSNTEYTVRVSYLELYNEELVDLLSSEDGSKLRIYEDVYNKNEVYKIMAQGQERKRVASTLMNAQSSRSHTVFTIVVHMKENSPEGEELVKIGKLNLVDLAGSENISKAGSDNPAKRERARECVNINQSLLTLGRVITALVERHPHIPYRESKLTRILQESLGGRTKTSIIATISPGHKDLEETMSTLEYANRAKNIQNKPEVNQKLTKKAILKDYAEEIDRLKRDLHAAREKNGVYLANDTFAEMTLKQEEQRKEIQELLLKKRAMEEERERIRQVFQELRNQLEDKLRNTQDQLAKTNENLRTTKQQYLEQRHLASVRANTEKVLTEQATKILEAADSASADALGLHDAVDRRRKLEEDNLGLTTGYREHARKHRDYAREDLNDYMHSLIGALKEITDHLDTFTNMCSQTHCDNEQTLNELVKNTMNVMEKIKTMKDNVSTDIEETTKTELSTLRENVKLREGAILDVLNQLSNGIQTNLKKTEVDDLGLLLRVIEELRSASSARVKAVRESGGRVERAVRETGGRLRSAAGHAREHTDGHAGAMDRAVRDRLALLMEEKSRSEKYLAEQMAVVENERREIEIRLKKWEEDEMKRIKLHVDTERSLLEDRLAARVKDIEEQRRIMEERMTQNMDWLNGLLESSDTQRRTAEEDLNALEKELQSCMTNVDGCIHEMDQESIAIISDTDKRTEEAVKVVEKIQKDLQGTVTGTDTCIQSIAADTQSLSEVADLADKTVNSIEKKCNETVDSMVNEFEATSSEAIESVRRVEALSHSLAENTRGHRHEQGEALQGVRQRAEALQNDLVRELDALNQLDERCLWREYAVYRPSGSTPARRPYNYPRSLAATSPESLVLARLTSDSVLEDSSDEDLIEDLTTTDESIVNGGNENGTNNRKQREESGKENVNSNRSMSFKKPSKLPAPSSIKKPLVDRNEY
ncbi:unnamed protein product [Danaus chrysippus]|uniref:(African queen) hypothetical protein n=1 Tax=Danaus chrysippus TaxID=151541 RepID=A0A8J2QSG4_9NEOP|nr:unnamed protein product [Danaus chrysippus]